MTKRKNLDLTKECIYTLTVEAAKKKTNFKRLAQDILEREAVNINKAFTARR